MSKIFDGQVLAGSAAASEFGSGTGGLLVVVLLGAVSIALFVALSGSLKRMRANVESGQFSAPPRAEDTDGSGDDHDAGITPKSTDKAPSEKVPGDKVPGQGNGSARS